ncbi:DUF4238 domain-containing protein [Acinetobacter bereziniae]|uniref:DUF4238 domain-containing protein n=1 Tax=Acinetobacter bereziniae TaxID=106648 RepID=UPI00125EE098|nr:DUF4238 domain-containing protein [Acinetobacter bereziniae]
MNLEKINIKKKHHFVSQFYLQRWTKNGVLRISNGKGHIFNSKVENIGFESKFYKIVMFKFSQIKLFEEFCIKNDFDDLESFKLIVGPLLDLQKTIYSTEEYIKKLEYKKINCDKKTEELNKLKEIFKYNTIEDKFNDEESQYSLILSKVINSNNKTIFTFKDYCSLIFFAIFQLFKTPNKINNITFSDENKKKLDEFNFDKDELHTFKIYCLLCITERINQIRLKNVDKINVYYNISAIDFITSDDPCFNQISKNSSFYIQLPISPRVSIEICENNEKNKSEIFEFYNNDLHFDSISVSGTLINFCEADKKYVADLNKKILANKDKHIFYRKK